MISLLRKALIPFPPLLQMDGLRKMPHLLKKPQRHFVFLFVISILILPLPMLVGSNTNTESTQISEKVTDELIELAANTEATELIPALLRFPETTDYEQMLEAVWFIQSNEVEIRHVFNSIPFVSIYTTPAGIELLENIPLVESVSIDREWSISSSSEFQPAQSEEGLGYVHPDGILGADTLWSDGFDGTGVTVAILDSGAMGDHEDLEGRMIGFYDFIEENHDMDPSDGVDAYDDNGHGTSCAWLVAGTGVGTDGDYTGIAPGADLLIIKVLDSEGAGDDSVIAQGIDFAVAQGADIISLSVGGEWSDVSFLIEPSVLAVENAIQAGVTVVISAGNTGPATFTINSPGIVEGAITVGASSGNVGIVPFSSRGPLYYSNTEPTGYFAKPDIVAPGYYVLTARDEASSSFDYPIYNATQWGLGYTLFSGTSASAPQVAALAALLIDKHPALTPTEVKAFLMAGATDMGSDPMEQGYGIANASMSSDLIDQTSGIITLMTPLRYPTLPGTANVFLMGDERPDQNVTIISTVNRGTVDIVLSGNASQFVTTTVDEVPVGAVGYAHFGIGLTIPDDLPLTAIGDYVGTLELIDEGETISSIDLEFTLTTYGGTVLVDMAHHNPDDPDDISYYRYFGEYLREQGMVFSEHPENWETTLNFPPIDGNALAGVEVLMIMDTETEYSVAEVDTIHQFVEEGGKLLILSEGFDTQAGIPAFAFESYNRILEPYGIQCEENWIGVGTDEFTGRAYGLDHNGAVDPGPLMEGVENLYILNGGSLRVDSSIEGTEGLFWVDSEKTHAIVATAEYGEGEVIVVSDGS
ncbi:MAG: S8 family serine peptidase, partial [Candidatus Thorarchaeota archaeon]